MHPNTDLQGTPLVADRQLDFTSIFLTEFLWTSNFKIKCFYNLAWNLNCLLDLTVQKILPSKRYCLSLQAPSVGFIATRQTTKHRCHSGVTIPMSQEPQVAQPWGGSWKEFVLIWCSWHWTKGVRQLVCWRRVMARLVQAQKHMWVLKQVAALFCWQHRQHC